VDWNGAGKQDRHESIQGAIPRKPLLSHIVRGCGLHTRQGLRVEIGRAGTGHSSRRHYRALLTRTTHVGGARVTNCRYLK